MTQTAQPERKYVYEYTIVGGPGKFDLMVGFFKKGERLVFRIRKNFGDKSNEVVRCTINTISHEDGSCESWCIDGWISDSGPDVDHLQNVSTLKQNLTFKGYYSTHRNQGWMQVTVTQH
ncbi:MAG: hypothetical protein NTY30_04385 [Candidatus Berkelbacteria bacterium]|nr:hypothetical protein [Candidatus Berkelbacteria bacterium]